MLYNSLHNRWLRNGTAVAGTLLMAIALNVFIVPLHLYAGGLMGLCQVISTLLQNGLGVSFGDRDIAGILYFLGNIPILLLGFRTLGRRTIVRTVIGVVAYTIFTSAVPIPAEPVVDDYLTACLLGGILNGAGSGLVLTCGCSTGGMDIVGLSLSKLNAAFTVGRFSMTFNALLYAACLVLFSPETAIYSIIYNFTSNLVLDRVHQQNVSMQAMIFTRGNERELGRFVTDRLRRGITFWDGTGAYTGQGVHVLCVTLSRYEVDELLHVVRSFDPHAFITIQRVAQIYGNYVHRVE